MSWAIEAKGLRLPFQDSEAGDLELRVPRGCVHAIVGPSGSGKTTLTRILLGVVPPPIQSVVKVLGFTMPIRSRSERLRFARRVSFIMQDASGSLDPSMRVSDIITEPLAIQKRLRGRHARDVAAELLEKVGLAPEFAGRRPAALSGGQAQRVAIARAISTSPDLMVADEPFSALDPILRAELLQLLLDLKKDMGLTLLLVTHDLEMVQACCDGVTSLGRYDRASHVSHQS